MLGLTAPFPETPWNDENTVKLVLFPLRKGAQDPNLGNPGENPVTSEKWELEC